MWLHGFLQVGKVSVHCGRGLGGVIGAFITITVIQSMGSLGPARSVMLIVISQLAVAYLIELMGLFGVERADFQWRKLFGMLICIAGVVIFKWK